jgi:hypothetical protein
LFKRKREKKKKKKKKKKRRRNFLLKGARGRYYHAIGPNTVTLSLFAAFIDGTWFLVELTGREYDGGHKNLGVCPINNALHPVPQNHKTPPVF